MNNKAQLFTLDLLLALVSLTLVLGMSANAIVGVTTQIQEYSTTYAFYVRTNDALDVLVKTSGVPVDWEDSGNISLVGLAAWDISNNKPISNYIDAWKYYSLNSSDLVNLLGTSNYNLSIYIYNMSSYNISNFSLPNYGAPVPDNATEIISAERIALIDNLLAIKSASPNGLTNINNTEHGGGATETCDSGEDSLFLTQAEIDTMQFWFYMTFTPSPKTMMVQFNRGCAKDNCNQILDTQDFPIKNKFNIWPTSDGWTNKTKNYAGPGVECKDGGSTEVEYWTNVSDLDEDNETFTMYVKVPKEFLVPGYQEVYVWLNGPTTMEAGWIADAPQTVTREQLEAYFEGIYQLDDIPIKLVLKVWK